MQTYNLLREQKNVERAWGDCNDWPLGKEKNDRVVKQIARSEVDGKRKKGGARRFKREKSKELEKESKAQEDMKQNNKELNCHKRFLLYLEEFLKYRAGWPTF